MKMSFVRIRLIGFFIVVLWMITPVFAEQTSDLLDPWYKWQPINQHTLLAYKDGQIQVKSQGAFSGIFNRRMASMILEEKDLLILEMKASKGGLGSILWTDYSRPEFNQAQRLSFYLGRPNQWKTYYINLAHQERNSGRVDFILINPLDGQGVARIRTIKLVKGNVWQGLLAAFQEFMGPRGREIVGYTINTMPSPNLFGKPVFIYIYWLFVVVLLVITGREMVKQYKEQGKLTCESVFSEIGKKAFLVMVVLWLFLEVSTWYSNWLNLKRDLPLVGKSLEEKRAMVNTGDFYAFIQFCQKKLPDRVPFDMSIPPIYNDIKATYYLYPHEYRKGAQYLIVYDKPVDKVLLAKYEILAKFRKGAFILKSR